ncbi:MAG: PSD1 domain-containing protein [Planctomycetaceae bacterium]|nr:PSD1 domain-containing protein [Planctomycetaceae bacterium]
MTLRRFLAVVSGLCCLACACPSCSKGRADETASAVYADLEVQFVRAVLPILRTKCFACHGKDPEDIRGNLSLLSLELMKKGGDSGKSPVQPGRPESSPLMFSIRRNSDDWSPMPPKENDQLTELQVQAFQQWIENGAPWPDAARIAAIEVIPEKPDHGRVRLATSGGLSADWNNRTYQAGDLWAYQTLPGSSETLKAFSGDSTQPPVDRIIAAAAEKFRIPPADVADRRTLIRRATFDLLGLPPSLREVRDFVNDPRPVAQAFATVVDRLLESPHYGEQWGQHWLDVARYADSSGFANDYERGNAWRYRDYVVRSFNSDKRFDQFIVEQIAGDEIVELRAAEKLHDHDLFAGTSDDELIIATGFLRMGPWELTGMEVEKVARQRFLDDVTDSVGQVFLGQLLQCARCHDHKFDPVPTRDYYSIQAAFATTQLAERPAAFLAEENTAGFDEQKYLLQRRKYYEQMTRQLDARSVAAARQWLVDNTLDTTVFDSLVSGSNGEPDYDQIRNQMRKRGIPEEQVPPRHAGFEPRDFGMERVSRKGIERLAWRLDRYQPKAHSVYSGRTPQLGRVNQPLAMPAERFENGTLEATAILAGGDPFSPTDPVTPGVLSSVQFTSLSTQTRPESRLVHRTDESQEAALVGRRLDLAAWIASGNNPLTPRVIANRVWQWHFGRPLAANPNNFGTTGQKPTHPELLDYLAASLVENNWSIKSLHRMIMNTETYRRSSMHPDPKVLAEKDPNDISYAVFPLRRLTAEEIRDAMLAVSGELNPTVGGIPVNPDMNLDVAFQPRMVMGTFAEAWQPSPLPEQRNRRSLYALRIRGIRDPFQEVFNAPPSELSCENRDTTTVTPQVFAMFNSTITLDRAVAMAHDLLTDTSDDRAALNIAYERVFSRNASDEEITACLDHWQSMTKRHESLTFKPVRYPTELVRNAVEENTGEKFQFSEPLEMLQDYVPGIQLSDVDAKTRGLAEVCLVLLNSSEFLFVE